MASLLVQNTNSVPNKKLSEMEKLIGPKSCPDYSKTVQYTITRDAESINRNTYIFDGTLFHDNGNNAGFLAIGCQKSPFLSDIYLLGSGVCTIEVLLVDRGVYNGVVVGAGTTVFGFANEGSTVTITGGDGCALGARGHIDLFSDQIVIAFE